MENGTVPSVPMSKPAIPIVVTDHRSKEARRIFFEKTNGHSQNGGHHDHPEDDHLASPSAPGESQRASVTGVSGTQFTVTTVRTPDDVHLKEPLLTPPGMWNAFTFSDPATQLTVQSIASMGMGCSDGKKLYLRRVPTTASELISMVNPIA
jgi:hypothetical protein